MLLKKSKQGMICLCKFEEADDGVGCLVGQLPVFGLDMEENEREREMGV